MLRHRINELAEIEAWQIIDAGTVRVREQDIIAFARQLDPQRAQASRGPHKGKR